MSSSRANPTRSPLSLNAPEESDDLNVRLLDAAEGGDRPGGGRALSVASEPDKAAADDKTRSLVISFVLMLVVGLGNKIFQVLQFIPMYNYPLLVNLLTTFIYIPLSFAYIFPMLKWGTLISEESTRIPKYKFAVMGALDSTAGIMQSLAVNFINDGSLVILLMQAAIPASMVISKLFLKTKYKASQYTGAIIVAIGLIIVLLPSFIHPNNQSGSNRIAWAVVLILSCVPMCLSSVYKEKALGDADIDAVYMNGWIAIFQFLFAIPLLIPSAVASSVPIKHLPRNLYNGLLCLGQDDSVMGGKHPDNCHWSPTYVSIYLIFNLAYNVLIILILKFGSSNILWLAMTVLVPLANASFALRFMPHHQGLTWEDILGLILIMGGLITYRFWSTVDKKYISKCRKPEPAGADVGSASPYMSTPMRGTLVHTSKKKPGRTTSK